MSKTQIIINRWSAWLPGISTRAEWQDWQQGKRQPIAGETPSLQEIPPMLRRRLSPLGKMALSVAWPLLPADTHLPSLFCSRHGELERTVTMLQNLAQGEALSPTHFSLSVHNAIGGVFSIARGDTSAISALAVGPEGFSNALLEAQMILAEQGVPELLCVVYDAPLPTVYEDFGRDPLWPYAAAFVLGNGEQHSASTFSLALRSRPAAEAVCPADEPQAMSFLRLLLDESRSELLLAYRDDLWCWRPVTRQQG